MAKRRPPTTKRKKKRAARSAVGRTVAEVMAAHRSELLADWLAGFRVLAGGRLPASISEEDLRRQASEVLQAIVPVLAAARDPDVETPEFSTCAARMREISARRAEQGFPPAATAALMFSLKEVLLRFLQEELADEPDALGAEIVKANEVIDRLGMLALEAFAHSREEVVSAQSRSLLELSTPALKVWERMLLVPLIGVIDTARVQQIMEVLLRSIVETESEVVILDITGVPVVDTKVAQSLVKTVAAVKMLGAETIVTGIRPEVALTLTKVDPPLEDIRTCGSLRAGVATGFVMLGLRVGREGGGP